MPDHPTNRPWKQVLPIALLILGLGIYGQYSRAAGVFAADGLLLRAEQVVERLLAPSLPPELPVELAGGILETPPPAAAVRTSTPNPRQPLPFRDGRPVAGGFVPCPARHCR